MTLVHSAGGVVWRTGSIGTEVMLVHRPRYDDWTLPKGKLEPGEHVLLAAVREVREETGLDGRPQVRLPTIEYLTGVPGVEKLVDFWSMRLVHDHGREADHEVDAVRWVPVGAAAGTLTYAHDRGVVAAFAKLPEVTATVLLVRHAHAGSRRDWTGPDLDRPLSTHGRRELEMLEPVLRLFGADRVVSAPALRCRQTVSSLGVTVEIEPALGEFAPTGVAGAVAAVRALAKPGTVTVVCSQGKVIPPLLTAIRPRTWSRLTDLDTPKGTGWVLALAGTDLVGADRLP